MKVIKLEFKRREKDSIILKTEENEDVVIPSRYIPYEIKEGSILYIKIQKKLIEDENRKELARAVLEEILNEEE